MSARVRCDIRCERTVEGVVRALTRVAVRDLGWGWLAGIFGTVILAGAAWYWWGYVRDWLRQ